MSVGLHCTEQSLKYVVTAAAPKTVIHGRINIIITLQRKIFIYLDYSISY